MSAALSHILGSDGRAPGNLQNVQKGIQIWNVKLHEFRVSMLKERYWENYSLSWTFWYLIYNNDVISMEQMKHHFKNVEQNPKIQNLPEQYSNELTAMTEMVTHFNSNPCIGFWYVYWHDVHKMNSDLPGIKANMSKFDPTVRSIFKKLKNEVKYCWSSLYNSVLLLSLESFLFVHFSFNVFSTITAFKQTQTVPLTFSQRFNYICSMRRYMECDSHR